MAEYSRKYYGEEEKLSTHGCDVQNTICSKKNVKRGRTKPKKCKICGVITRHYCEDFCDKTSLHAVQYVGDSGRTILERLCWLIAIMASLSVCFYLISIQWRKWEDTPVIVSLSDAPTPIWEIPFPAVTICPEIKVKQTEFNFTELFEKENRTNEEELIFDQLGLLCNSKIFLRKMFLRTNEFVSAINFSTNYIEKFAPKIDDILIQCGWMDEPVDCKSIFTPVMTEEGLCFTFNSLNANDMLKYSQRFGDRYLKGPRKYNWTLEGGYAKDIEDDDSDDYEDDDKNSNVDDYGDKINNTKHSDIKTSYPRRSNKPGESGGLVLYLKSDEKDFDYACRWPVAGFKVLLHNPVEFPRLLTHFFRVPLKRDVVATIDAHIMTSSSEISRYPYTSRGCLFQNEHYSQYFKNYTMSNCEVECLVNATLEACSCVPFYFPGEENATVCKTYDLCLLLVSDALMKGNNLLGICECLPSCEEVNYKARVSQSHLVWPQVLRHINRTKANVSENFGRLSIYFQDIQFITSRRSELFGYTDFLANCGGLLGLCCGFSVLSAVEIFYFISLCLCGRRK